MRARRAEENGITIGRDGRRSVARRAREHSVTIRRDERRSMVSPLDETDEGGSGLAMRGRLLCSGSFVHFQISSAAKFPQSGATARECLFRLVSCRRSLKTSSLRRFQPGSLRFGVFSGRLCLRQSRVAAASSLIFSGNGILSCGSSQLVRDDASVKLSSGCELGAEYARSVLWFSKAEHVVDVFKSSVFRFRRCFEVFAATFQPELAGFVLSSVVGLGWIRAKDWCRQSLMGSCREYLYSERRRKTSSGD
ncbi:hypothetical protein YC2023_121838 [Brassica napus]